MFFFLPLLVLSLHHVHQGHSFQSKKHSRSDCPLTHYVPLYSVATFLSQILLVHFLPLLLRSGSSFPSCCCACPKYSNSLGVSVPSHPKFLLHFVHTSFAFLWGKYILSHMSLHIALLHEKLAFSVHLGLTDLKFLSFFHIFCSFKHPSLT